MVDRGGGSTERATGGFRASSPPRSTSGCHCVAAKAGDVSRGDRRRPGVPPRGLSSSRPRRHSGSGSTPRSRCSAPPAPRTRSFSGGDRPARAVDPPRGPPRRELLPPGRLHPADGDPPGLPGVGAARRGGAAHGGGAGARARRRGLRVRTSAGTQVAGVVVNAAGAWAGTARGDGGVEVPVSPLRRQVAVTAPTAALPASMPMLIFPDGFHLRVRDGRVLLLWPSDGAEARSTSRSTRTGPARSSPRPRPGADAHPVPGSSALGDGCVLGAAPGGSPRLSTGRAPTLDVEALRPDRFVEGRPNPTRRCLCSARQVPRARPGAAASSSVERPPLDDAQHRLGLHHLDHRAPASSVTTTLHGRSNPRRARR